LRGAPQAKGLFFFWGKRGKKKRGPPRGGGGGESAAARRTKSRPIVITGDKEEVESSADSHAVRSFLHTIRTENCLKFLAFVLFRIIGNCFVMSRNGAHPVFYSMGTGVVSRRVKRPEL